MKKFKFALKNSIVLIVLFSIFIACEEDFASIDSDIINEDTATNFNTASESFEVITYNDALGPVQTNSLGVNLLGVYDDPNYGRTTASVVTQVTPNVFNPNFGENIILDSVVINIPFFSRNIGFTENNIIDFELDSVLPRVDSNSPIKLSIYENNFFLRDFNPLEGFSSPQSFFSDQSLSTNEIINDADLEGVLIHTEERLLISDEPIILTDTTGVTQILNPGIRLAFNRTTPQDLNVINYWQEKILNENGNIVLSNANNFNNFFRGIYFKAEFTEEGNGSLLILDLAQNTANITLHYSNDSSINSGQRNQETYVINFGQNRVNFFENNFNFALIDGDEINGDSRLFLKGGEGSIAGIKLFNGENTDSNDDNDNMFEAWRKEFVNLNEDGTFESSKRLVNEANLVFYVDQDMVNGEEPDRIYLYDKDNSIPLIDYFNDLIIDSDPRSSVLNHLPLLEREDRESDGDGQGIRYKVRITSHINNLLLQDSTNVELGLSISSNINIEGAVSQRAQLTPNGTLNNIPVSSIISPRGTILHGSNSEDTGKRVFLEIFYTCLNTDENCEENN